MKIMSNLDKLKINFMFLKKIIKISQNNQGFNLVETLVGISIFSVSLISLMSALSSGTSSITNAKNKLTATYLAQEGIEYTHNLRDNKIIAFYTDTSGSTDSPLKRFTAPFKQKCFNDINATLPTITSCYLQNLDTGTISDEEIKKCAEGEHCGRLLFDSNSGEYGDQGTNTDFDRTISIDEIVGEGDKVDEITIDSSVKYKGGDQEVKFSENLFNW